MNHALGHLSVAVDALVVLEPLLLNLSGCYDTLAYGCTRFAWCSFAYVLERYGRYLALYVDAVEKGTTNLVHITLYLSRCAYTIVRRVSKISTWTWVHGCNKHERTWVVDGVFHSADGDVSVFKRLA